MPYYKNSDKDHVLYIHIPKTGGSSIENYFMQKYKDISLKSIKKRDLNSKLVRRRGRI